MKYYNLYIDFPNSRETHDYITKILGVIPESCEDDDEVDIWHYQLCGDTNDPQLAFIDVFLDLLDPHFNALADIGIQKSNIQFWFVYGYESQCSMEFDPKEMLRLGESKVGLNIDCHQVA